MRMGVLRIPVLTRITAFCGREPSIVLNARSQPPIMIVSFTHGLGITVFPSRVFVHCVAPRSYISVRQSTVVEVLESVVLEEIAFMEQLGIILSIPRLATL